MGRHRSQVEAARLRSEEPTTYARLGVRCGARGIRPEPFLLPRDLVPSFACMGFFRSWSAVACEGTTPPSRALRVSSGGRVSDCLQKDPAAGRSLVDRANAPGGVGALITGPTSDVLALDRTAVRVQGSPKASPSGRNLSVSDRRILPRDRARVSHRRPVPCPRA